MPVLDMRELLEQLLPLSVGFNRGQRAVQVRRVAFVAVVFVPGFVGLRPVGRGIARLSQDWRIHQGSIAALHLRR